VAPKRCRHRGCVLLMRDDRIRMAVDKPVVYALGDTARLYQWLCGATAEEEGCECGTSNAPVPISCGPIQFYVDHRTVTGSWIQYFGGVPKRTLVPHNPA